MPPRPLPNPTAVFDSRFVFTTLSDTEVASHAKVPYTHPNGKPCRLFTLDEEMRYNSFAMDHGPLNLAMTFHACIAIYEAIHASPHKRQAVCLYTSPGAETKSNMALLVALYFLIVGKREPWDAFGPIAQLEVMPFRDAGNGLADHGLSIQDCLYGVAKALQHRLLDLVEFDSAQYQYYELVENGDLNILGDFIPFASPNETSWVRATRMLLEKSSARGRLSTPTDVVVPKGRLTSHGFKCVLDVFKKQNVGVVVRLNDELYDRRHFLDAGMEHVEMYFDDGSNPTDEIVRDFIKLAEEVIERRNQKVAVHCKAGLGRTGVLIGAYLIYKYHFSAQEVIGYMRIVRPGMVVGPQQQFMIMNQMKWIGWAARDQLLRELAAEAAAREPVNPLATPPIEFDTPLPSPPLQLAETGLQLPNRKTPSRMRTSVGTPGLRQPVSPSKGGDAAGQPRKSPSKPAESYVEIGTPEPETEHVAIVVDPASPSPTQDSFSFEDDHLQSKSIVLSSSQYEATSSSAPTSPASPSGFGSMRGTKRAATSRSPMQSRTPPLDGDSSPARTTLKAPPLVHIRHSNTSSTSLAVSEEERPAKRRPRNESALSAKSGLSSPPPSRESSPMDSEDVVTEVDALDTILHPAPVAARLSSKLRKLASSSPAAESVPLPSSPSATLSKSSIPTRRSFLPVRRAAAPMKESKPIPSALETTRLTRRSAVTSAMTANVPRSAVAPPERKSGGRADKRTPTKFASEMWGQISKIGSLSPVSCESLRVIARPN
ncbi:cell division cycle 14, partial [Tremellales sp. Uapishka_1]